MERDEVQGRAQEGKPLSVEYVRYESPALVDTEALAARRAGGGCGVCITGGAAALTEEAVESAPEAPPGASG